MPDSGNIISAIPNSVCYTSDSEEGSVTRADLANGSLAIYLKVNPTAHRTPLMVSKQHEEQSCLPSLRLHFFFSAVVSKPTKTITKHKTVEKNNACK